ncbi:MAG: hypothetical protein M0Z53_01160 [Thermaerobacter sp.]|nr:hypothetical protein [Thermaerobacter sp.]
MADGGHARSIPVLKVTTTRACWMGCAFCDFATPVPLRNPGRVAAAIAPHQLPPSWPREELVKIRGGLTVTEPFGYFVNLVRRIRHRTASPIQAFSAVELDHHHRVERRPVHELLSLLRDAGATNLGPGGGEWLIDPIRQQLSPYRLPAQRWLEIAVLAADNGISPAGLVGVAPFVDEEAMDTHLTALLQIRQLAHVVVKPFRPAGTKLAMFAAPHLLTVASIIEEIRRRRPSLPIYMSGTAIGEDGRWLLVNRGLTAFWDTVLEVGP